MPLATVASPLIMEDQRSHAAGTGHSDAAKSSIQRNILEMIGQGASAINKLVSVINETRDHHSGEGADKEQRQSQAAENHMHNFIVELLTFTEAMFARLNVSHR